MVASVGSLADQLMFQGAISQRRIRQRGKQGEFVFFLSLSSESRTLPLHLWQLLALTHRKKWFRDKGGDRSGLGCVDPFVSRRISFHGVYRLACTDITGEETRAALQSACMIDELTFLAALTCLH